jgi:uncharacterized protein YpuA (DUF1002 family)
MKNKAKRMAVGVGAGILTAAALAAAGAYVLSDKKTQAKAKAWAVKAKQEVAKKVRQAKQLSEGEYKHMVDEAMKRYGLMHNVSTAEVVKFAKDVKNEWGRIQDHAEKIAKAAQGKRQRKAAKPTRRTKA